MIRIGIGAHWLDLFVCGLMMAHLDFRGALLFVGVKRGAVPLAVQLAHRFHRVMKMRVRIIATQKDAQP